VNRLVGWVAALGVVGATAALVALTPTDMNTAMELRGQVGDRITSRTLQVEVVGVQLTERLDITYDDLDGSTDGVWIVVDAIVAPMLDTESLDESQVRIGGTSWDASSILDTGDMRSLPYGPGVAQRGQLVFEVPRSAIEGGPRADIVIRSSADDRLDSVAVVSVDLGALEVSPSVDIGIPAVVDVQR
jgi:hypothetical protein